MHLKDPSCPQGYTTDDITNILGDREEKFWYWMRGQTMSICEGTTYDHNRKGYFSTECSEMLPGMPVRREEIPLAGHHGPVVYGHDLKRFLLGLPVID